jgi:hypothetical protein
MDEQRDYERLVFLQNQQGDELSNNEDDDEY